MNPIVKSNILKLYVIKLSKWLMLTMPILFLFYKENGLSTQDLFLLKAAYSFAIVVMEVPSGYFGDIWGRKKSLILGSALGFVGFLLYAVSHGFWSFLLCELILGIGQSFISGSDSALLYDTLLAAGEKRRYTQIEGKLISLGNFAEAIAAPMGVTLALISLRTPFIFQALVAFTALPAAIFLHEPNLSDKAETVPSHAKKKQRMSDNGQRMSDNGQRVTDNGQRVTDNGQRVIQKDEMGEAKHGPSVFQSTDILDIVRYTLVENRLLKWHIFYSSIMGTATLTMAWFVQPCLDHFQVPLGLYGVIIPLLNLTAGFTAIYAWKLETHLGQNRTLFFIVLSISSGYFLVGNLPALLAMSALFYFYLARGIATPVLRNYINEITPSRIRATVLSIRSLIIRLSFVIVGPLLGWYADVTTVPAALSAGGILFLIGGVGSGVALMKASQEAVSKRCRPKTLFGILSS